MNAKVALRKELEKKLAALAKASSSVADLVEALGAAVATAATLESEAQAIGRQLELDVPGSIDEMATRALAEQGLRLVKLGPFDVAPEATATIPGATARLRARRQPAPVRGGQA